MLQQSKDENVSMGFTVCALLYGDHWQLGNRCISSILRGLDSGIVRDIRIGFNAVSDETRAGVRSLLEDVPEAVAVRIYDAGSANALKYPMMRKMFHGDAASPPVTTTKVMWLDDDSYIADGAPGWWWQAYTETAEAELAGQPYRMRLQGLQASKMRLQRWYSGKPIEPSGFVKFITGGFWIASTKMLQKWDYPFAAIRHNGGDVVLGELCRQQNYRVLKWHLGVEINSALTGTSGTAARRGYSSKPLWSESEEPETSAEEDFINIIVFDPRTGKKQATVPLLTMPDLPGF